MPIVVNSDSFDSFNNTAEFIIDDETNTYSFNMDISTFLDSIRGVSQTTELNTIEGAKINLKRYTPSDGSIALWYVNLPYDGDVIDHTEEPESLFVSISSDEIKSLIGEIEDLQRESKGVTEETLVSFSPYFTVDEYSYSDGNDSVDAYFGTADGLIKITVKCTNFYDYARKALKTPRIPSFNGSDRWKIDVKAVEGHVVIWLLHENVNPRSLTLPSSRFNQILHKLTYLSQ